MPNCPVAYPWSFRISSCSAATPGLLLVWQAIVSPVSRWVIAAAVTSLRSMAEKVLELDSDNVNALKIRYDARRGLGDEDGARHALGALVEADPGWAATDLFNHAVDLYNSDEMQGAAAALARVVEANPADAKARYLLGMASYNLGDMTAAKEHLHAFVELAPDDPDAAVAREMLKYAR